MNVHAQSNLYTEHLSTTVAWNLKIWGNKTWSHGPNQNRPLYGGNRWRRRQTYKRAISIYSYICLDWTYTNDFPSSWMLNISFNSCKFHPHPTSCTTYLQNVTTCWLESGFALFSQLPSARSMQGRSNFSLMCRWVRSATSWPLTCLPTEGTSTTWNGATNAFLGARRGQKTERYVVGSIQQEIQQ